MPKTKRATVYFDPNLHRALRVKAAETERSLSDLVNAAVRHSLAEDAEDLAAFEAGDEITVATLTAKGLVKKKRPVKILGHGDVTKAYTVDVDAVTGTAREKLTAAGGTVA